MDRIETVADGNFRRQALKRLHRIEALIAHYGVGERGR
jgi:hypothetical protein